LACSVRGKPKKLRATFTSFTRLFTFMRISGERYTFVNVHLVHPILRPFS